MVSRIHPLRVGPVAWLSSILACVLGTSASGTSVVEMDLAGLSDHAGQVFSGTVKAVRSYWADDPRRIESVVTFEQVEYLKGVMKTSLSTCNFVIPGGTVGQTKMRIGGAPTFEIGERWILFVLPRYRTFPVVGVHRGAFRIIPDASGTLRVFSASQQPITTIDSGGRIQTVGCRVDAVDDHPRACPDGAPEVSEASVAMTLRNFLARVQPTLERSRDHRLVEPAGKRTPADHSPVPLVPSTSRRDRSPSGGRGGGTDLMPRGAIE